MMYANRIKIDIDVMKIRNFITKSIVSNIISRKTNIYQLYSQLYKDKKNVHKLYSQPYNKQQDKRI